jgi:hypothetical protein
MSKYIGVVAGFPICVGLDREENDTLGLYLHSFMPQVEGETFASCLDRSVGLDVSLQTTSVKKSWQCLHDGGLGRGWPDTFGKSWQEMVQANSPYFQQGKMSITLTVKKMGKDD